MNLLGKKKSLGALVLGLLLFNSCENNGPFGLSSDDVAPVEFFTADIPVTSTVVWLDSIQSSNQGVYLIGDVTSTTFGRMQAKTFTRLNLNPIQAGLLPSESEYDSIRLNLQFIYSFDTSSTSRDWGYDAHTVRGIVDTLHITSDFSLDENDFRVQSELTISDFDSVYTAEFDDAWGREVHQLLKDESMDVETQDDFVNFFRGLSIVPKAGFGDNIYGLTIGENTNLTIYYRDPGNTGDIDLQQEWVFGLTNVIGYYNLSIDRTGTPTEFLQETNVEYTPTNGKRYVQSGAGIVTKLDLSGFRDLIQEQPRIINLAEITIGPIDELDESSPPPTQLFLAFTDERNTVIDDFANDPPLPFRTIQSDGNSPIGNRNPLALTYDSETRTYKGSMTSYFQTYFSGIFQRDEVFIYPSNMNTSVNGISFDAESINLKIIYSELQ